MLCQQKSVDIFRAYGRSFKNSKQKCATDYQKIQLFTDNAPSHPESFIDCFSMSELFSFNVCWMANTCLLKSLKNKRLSIVFPIVVSMKLPLSNSQMTKLMQYLQDYKTLWVLLNRAPTSTQFHPSPPRSIHLHPAHFNLLPAPYTSTQLILASIQLSATPSAL